MSAGTMVDKVMKSAEIKFVKPIIGFEASTSYVLEEFEAGSPFYWLSSLQDKQLRFIAINMFDFFPDYELNFTLDDENIMGGKRPGCLVFGLVTILGSALDATVNMTAPIVINSSKKTGAQLVNHNDKYMLKQPLIKKEISDADPVKERGREDNNKR